MVRIILLKNPSMVKENHTMTMGVVSIAQSI